MKEVKSYRIWYTNKKANVGKFEKKDYEIVKAFTGKKAVEIMKEKHPDCRFSQPVSLG